jgi:hypothetical protein
LTVEVVRNLTHMMLLLMATVPATLYADEKHSARLTLDDLRTELIKIIPPFLACKDGCCPVTSRTGSPPLTMFEHGVTVAPQLDYSEMAGYFMCGGEPKAHEHFIH